VELANVLHRVQGQTSPHPRILYLLECAVAGNDLPAPFPWSKAAYNDLSLPELREAIVGCGGSVAACGTKLRNRNLMDVYCHHMNVEAVLLLMELGGADVMNVPDVYGRTPIFTAAASGSRKDANHIGKATQLKLTRILCDANCRVDLIDVDGRNILQHAGLGMDQETQQIKNLLIARGAIPR